MYERFTDRGRKVIQLANQEARRRYHEYVGPEHILLGLVQEGSGVGANLLKNIGIGLCRIAEELEPVMKPAQLVTTGKLPLSAATSAVIEHTLQVAREFGDNYVGTEHLLFGLLQEKDCRAAQVLLKLGVTYEKLRTEHAALMGRNLDPPKKSECEEWLLKTFKDLTDMLNAPEYGCFTWVEAWSRRMQLLTDYWQSGFDSVRDRI